MSHATARLLVAMLVYEILGLSASVPTDLTLEMVVAVHRHGSRTRLEKHDLLHAEGGATLTPRGEQQLVQVGKDFRKRYLKPDCEAHQQQCLGGQLSDGQYHASEVHASSSGFDRTISSAQCLFQGLFDSTNASLEHWTPIPVYSSPADDDHVLRAYDKCPALTRNLQQFYASDAFTAKEQETQEFRSELAVKLKQNAVDLRSFWEEYDRIVVGSVYGGEAIGEPDFPTEWTDAELEAVQELAGWLEGSKFSSDTAGNLCGGSLLADIRSRIQAGVTDGSPRLVMFSAHYPTMLCLLSALGTTLLSTTEPAIFPMGPVPGYGASLAFEVYAEGNDSEIENQNTGTRRVRLVYQDGPSEEVYVLPMPCGSDDNTTSGGCSVSSFTSWTSTLVINSTHDWCQACTNINMTACSCLHLISASNGAAVDESRAEASGDSSEEQTTDDGQHSSRRNWGEIVSAAVCGAAVGALTLYAARCGLAESAARSMPADATEPLPASGNKMSLALFDELSSAPRVGGEGVDGVLSVEASEKC